MTADMSINHDLITDFADYAKMQLEDHTEQLKEKYNSAQASVESFRLKVFNEHLQALKSGLHRKMSEMLAQSANDILTKKELERQYNVSIDVFLKRDFNV